MKLLDYLERKLRRFAIPNLTLILVVGQSLFFTLAMAQANRGAPSQFLEQITFIPEKVLQGEFWRLLTFPFFPPSLSLIWIFFALYFFYLMGTALEHHWGAFRYNIYLLIAYAATIGSAFIVPGTAATNLFITGSVFLAFAWLYPDFVIYLFFILPVKIKWVALVTWIMYGVTFLTGDAATRLYVAASVLNFLLFFGTSIIRRARTGARHMQQQTERLATRDKPFHTCAVCGITDKTHPKMDFRYCPECGGAYGYCEEHMNNHPHKRPAVPATEAAPK